MEKRTINRHQLTQKELREQFDVKILGYNQYDITNKLIGNKAYIGNATTKHKYGKTLTYKVIAIKINNKWTTTTLQKFLYIYFFGEYDSSLEVDHINDNPFDNDLNNLQLLTKDDNLKKSRQANDNIGRNQYSYNLSVEEILQKRKEKEEEIQRKRDLKHQRINQKIELKEKIDFYKQEQKHYEELAKEKSLLWHSLLHMETIDRPLVEETKLEQKKYEKLAKESSLKWHQLLNN